MCETSYFREGRGLLLELKILIPAYCWTVALLSSLREGFLVPALYFVIDKIFTSSYFWTCVVGLERGNSSDKVTCWSNSSYLQITESQNILSWREPTRTIESKSWVSTGQPQNTHNLTKMLVTILLKIPFLAFVQLKFIF